MEQQKEGIDYFSSLPCDIIGIILSKISSPRDLCRLSAVSAALRSATKSDFLWEKFVPYDYLNIVTSNSTFTSSFFGPNKALFFHICNHHSPIFLQSKVAAEAEGGRDEYAP
ncbi:hypothetical protein TIFTF001_031582 [Ficus carica]|uniref:F-box domain-containing protein n=1 Tax=Ficus carica TaxID=3494 RepID=A0AA88DV71_FICCA|nr:hypothetical protein TIFTF001_031582 [Ficus carica]